jgi:hypothetical protein
MPHRLCTGAGRTLPSRRRGFCLRLFNDHLASYSCSARLSPLPFVIVSFQPGERQAFWKSGFGEKKTA